VNKSTEVVTAAPGAVQRQSVAVAVDAGAAKGLDMVSLSAMVAAAAGVDATRGDTIAVQAMTFDTTEAEAATKALAQADATAKATAQTQLLTKAATGGAIVLGLIILIIVVSIARRSGRKARRTALDLGELSVLGGAGSDPLALEGVGADHLPALPFSPVQLGPDPIALKRAEIGALADEQPDEVADLLRGWLVGSTGPVGPR